MKLYCPLWFNDEDSFKFFATIKRKIALISEAESFDSPAEYEARILELDRFFAEHNVPDCFDEDSPNNAARLIDVQFETLCSLLETNGNQNAAQLTTLQFYSRLEYLKKSQAKTKPE